MPHTTLALPPSCWPSPFLAACTENADRGGGAAEAATPRALTVESSTDASATSPATEAPAGTLTFDVTNAGSQVTEFYLLGEDGLRIVGEVENIGPNLNRELVVNAPAGSYVTACKPGMKGEGIRADFTVTKSDEAPTVGADDQELVDPGAGQLRAYVQDQSDQLLAKTKQFVDALQVGRRRRGPRALRRRPHPLGADRDGRRVLRRPRPDDGRPRGRPRARPGVDRLAPASRRTCGRSAPRTTRR